MDAGSDIGGFDVTIVDAEYQDQRHFGDEQQAEEEREPAQRFLAAFFEREVVNLIDRRAERVEHRQHQDADQDRGDAVIDVDEIREVGAEDGEARTRDVDDVEYAEGNRYAGGDGRVEATEQDSCGNRIDQQIEGNIHTLLSRRIRLTYFAFAGKSLRTSVARRRRSGEAMNAIRPSKWPALPP